LSARWVGFRARPLTLVALAYLSHLVGDYFASGPGWTMWPWLPFSARGYVCECPSALYFWVNFVATAGGFVALAWIAARDGRTPLEFVHPRLERALVGWLRLAPCTVCKRAALLGCDRCRTPICRAHAAAWRWRGPLCGACASAR